MFICKHSCKLRLDFASKLALRLKILTHLTVSSVDVRKTNPIKKVSIGSSKVLDDQYKRSQRGIKKTRRASCHVCKIWVTSKKALTEHEKGKQHQRNKVGVFGLIRHCEECKITLNSPKSLEQHLKGRSHIRRVEYLHRLERKKRLAEERNRKNKYDFLVELGQKRQNSKD